MMTQKENTSAGGWSEILRAFLKLGLTSFGGPIAHLGYFREEFVRRRRWLTDESYADLVALCQFLPGPASSQVGFALGYSRGGIPGALIAWCAFTLPSALLLLLFAFGAAAVEGPVGAGAIHGLKLVAVAIVAQAVWGMAQSLCPDRTRAAIAAISVLLIALAATAAAQIAAILFGAIAGLWLCKSLPFNQVGHLALRVRPRWAALSLALFGALLIGLPLLAAVAASPSLALFEAFYRAGALVFGGGHVVLPLLEASTVESGWVSRDAFLAGYGAAQAVPGPLFTFAAYLGAIVNVGPSGVVGAVIALIAIFLPGMLLLLGTLPSWDHLRRRPAARAAMAGANAAVVGILASALYQPVWPSAVTTPMDFAVALIAFLLLTLWKAAPWLIVVLTTLAGIAMALVG